MPTLYPEAEWRPLGPQKQAKMRSHDIVCLHTMVGSLAGTDRMFHVNGYGGTESHFGVGYDGTTYQWQDLEYTADANYNGNYRVISIETADFGEGPFGKWDTKSGSNVPAWTPQQLNRLCKILAWICQRYDIPLVLIPDTKPGRRGIAFHAQGIEPRLVDSGEVWSTAIGKVCPGPKRIAQIPYLIELTKAYIAAVNKTDSSSPTPLPSNVRDEMFTVLTPIMTGKNEFKLTCPIEGKGNSEVITEAWIRWFCQWGKITEGRIVPWSSKGPMTEYSLLKGDFFKIPAEARGFTIEGKIDVPTAIPSFALLVK